MSLAKKVLESYGVAEALEIWQMTKYEYEEKFGKPKNNTTVTGGFHPHKEAVETALNQGKKVPSVVLRDYPELSNNEYASKKDSDYIKKSKEKEVIQKVEAFNNVMVKKVEGTNLVTNYVTGTRFALDGVEKMLKEEGIPFSKTKSGIIQITFNKDINESLDLKKKLLTPKVIKKLDDSIKASEYEGNDDVVIESDGIIASLIDDFSPSEFKEFDSIDGWEKCEKILSDYIEKNAGKKATLLAESKIPEALTVPMKFEIAMEKLAKKPVKVRLETMEYALKNMMERATEKTGNNMMIKEFSAHLLSVVQHGFKDIVDDDENDDTMEDDISEGGINIDSKFKSALKTALKHFNGSSEKTILKMWNDKSPHFGGAGGHRYDDGEKNCSYCYRPINWKNVKVDDLSKEEVYDEAWNMTLPLNDMYQICKNISKLLKDNNINDKKAEKLISGLVTTFSSTQKYLRDESDSSNESISESEINLKRLLRDKDRIYYNDIGDNKSKGKTLLKVSAKFDQDNTLVIKDHWDEVLFELKKPKTSVGDLLKELDKMGWKTKGMEFSFGESFKESKKFTVKMLREEVNTVEELKEAMKFYLDNATKMTLGEATAFRSTIRTVGEKLGLKVKDLNDIFNELQSNESLAVKVLEAHKVDESEKLEPELQNKYDQLKKISDEGQMGKVEGVKMDVTTASMLVTILDNLKFENKQKFLSQPIKVMVGIGWKLTK